jgi:hypothetical protein
VLNVGAIEPQFFFANRCAVHHQLFTWSPKIGEINPDIILESLFWGAFWGSKLILDLGNLLLKRF